MTPVNVTLAVLAGGEGSRMGRPKTLLELSGRPILAELLDRLCWPGPTLLVTSPGRQNPPAHERFNAEAIDPAPGLGPLRGLLTALEFSTTPSLLATTVDMPGIGAVHLRWLVDELAKCPTALGLMSWREDKSQSRIEPFPSIYRSTARPLIASRLAQGARSVYSLSKLAGFITIASPVIWPVGVWTNLNEPEDLRRWETRKKESGG